MKTLTHMLIEATDEMSNTIAHIDEVTGEQNALVALIVQNDKDNKFEKFIASMKEQIDNTVQQKAALVKRLETLKEVVEECQADEKTAKTVTKLCIAFGIFGAQIEEETEATEVKGTQSKVIHHDFRK